MTMTRSTATALLLVVSAFLTFATPATAVGPTASRAAGAAVAPAAPLPTAVTVEGTLHAQTILSRVNELRAGLGLPPVTRYIELDGVAQDWAERMVSQRTLAHRPDFTAAYPAGWISGSENVATCGGTSGDIGAQLFEHWLASPGYYDNMIDPDTNALGIGIAYDAGSDSWYATQSFASYPDPAGSGLTEAEPATAWSPDPPAQEETPPDEVPTPAPVPDEQPTSEPGTDPEPTPEPTPSEEATPTPSGSATPAPLPSGSATTKPTASPRETGSGSASVPGTHEATVETTETEAAFGIRTPLGTTLPLTGAGLLAAFVAVGGAVTGFVALMMVRRRVEIDGASAPEDRGGPMAGSGG